MNRLAYDAGMHPRPARAQTSPQEKSCRPRSGIPALVARGHASEQRAVLGQLPARAGTRGGGSVMSAPDPALELADLRKLLRDHHSRHAARSTFWPPAVDSATAITSAADRGNRGA